MQLSSPLARHIVTADRSALEEHYENLSFAAAWFRLEGDREAAEAAEQKLTLLWEKLQIQRANDR